MENQTPMEMIETDQESAIETIEKQRREANRKQIEAMIDFICVSNPELKGRLTVASCYQYLQLPDSAFGWVEKHQPMPMQAKKLVVSTSLKLGATPGLGHIYWLGNGMYCSAAFLRNKANADPEWVIKREEMMPFSKDEKECFGIEEGDMCLKIVQDIEYKGSVFTATGHGIIGADEIAKAHPKSTAYASKKNRVMHLKTRAQRDLLRRYYPCELSDLSEDEVSQIKQEDKQKAITVTSTPVADDGKKEIINNINEIITLRNLDKDYLSGYLKVDFSHEKLEMQSLESLINLANVLQQHEFDSVVEEGGTTDENVVPESDVNAGGPDPETQEELVKIQTLLQNSPIKGNEKLEVFVSQFTHKKLKKNDASRIFNGLKPAEDGDFSVLQDILDARENLA